MVIIKNSIDGVFPGRFQPFTNQHLSRLFAIQKLFPKSILFVLVGDVGFLNRENFLLPHERCEMIEKVCHKYFIKNVFVKPVKAASPPEKWAENVRKAAPNAGRVFSDNPFVYMPLQSAGFASVIHKREGLDSSALREMPFNEWKGLIPDEVYNYIKKYNLYNRLKKLPSTGKYPFLDYDEDLCYEQNYKE